MSVYATQKLGKLPLLMASDAPVVEVSASVAPASARVGRMTSLTLLEQRRLEELAAATDNGNYKLLEACWEIDYLKPPPSIHDFILDDYYLGRTWRPIKDENEGIWPAWLKLLDEHLSLNSKIHNMVITGSLGIGKCMGYNELLLMFDGSIKPVQAIKTGELLMGDDSTPRTVLSTMKGRGKLFQIYPAKGEAFTCNGDHVLCLKSSVSDTVEHVSVDDFQKWPRQRRHEARLYRVGADWEAKPVTVDPRWLGLWLGDGSARIIGVTTMDDEIKDYFSNYAASFGLQRKSYVSGKAAKATTYQFSVPGGRWAGPNRLMALLRSYGLSTPESEYEKFIPKEYLFNSREVRTQLLAGLLDTDGEKARGGKRTAARSGKQNNGVYEITSKYRRLADQIRFLAQSLGFFAKTKIKIVNSTAYYSTIISGAYEVPSLLARKTSNAQGQTVSPLTGHVRKADCLKTKFAVIPLDEGDYYGFELDGNHRFLLKDFTVTHNTAMLVTIILYRMCIATHLRNPQNFFGLNRNSKLVYNFLSVTKDAVKDTAYGTALSYMADSPYFIEVCKYNPDQEYAGYRVPMLNELPGGGTSGIWLTAGSKGQHVLGRNLIGIGLDEGNFRLEKDPDLTAYQLYDQVRTRIANRFQKIEGYLPAISVIASSAQDESSFTEKVVGEIDEANRQRDVRNRTLPPTVVPEEQSQIVFRNSVYKIKRHVLTGIGPDHHWFKVAYGLKNMEPVMLTGWYKEDGTPIDVGEEKTHEPPPAGAKTELVPKFYWEAYRRNCKAQLQNLSGISVGGAHRLFPNMIDIEWALEDSKKAGVPEPVLPGIQLLPISSEDNKQIWDYLNHKSFLTRVASKTQPIRHPQSQRYAHLDLATQTMAGLSICHLAGSQLVEGLVRDGEPFAEYRLIVEYDFILTICAGQNKPINFSKIQKFFFWLRDMCGYRFGLITADQFQCLCTGTLVDTCRGLLPIEQVRKGDLVQSKTGVNPVTNTVKYSQVPVLRITTNKGHVLCGTPNHRIEACQAYRRWFPLAQQVGWVRLDQLRPGDVVSMVSQPTDLVCLNQRLIQPQSASRMSTVSLLKHWEYPPELKPELAVWLGLVWGDGSISAKRVALTAHINDRRDVTSIYRHLFGIVPAWSDGRAKTGCMSFHEKRFTQWLLDNGFAKPAVKKAGGYRGELGLPEPILRSSREVKAAFLRGLFSADGCICGKEGYISLSTKHRKTAEQVCTLLRTEFGLRSTLVTSWRKGYGKVRKQHIVRIIDSRLRFSNEIGFCYTRKQNLLDSFKHIKGRNLVERVVKIEQAVADVFDIEVANDPSYTANGFVSHNSEMPLQELEGQNFVVKRQSIDKDKTAYVTWRAGFEERRIRLHRSEYMLREAENLLEMDKKFDHDATGSKDTIDSAAGAYVNAVNSDEKLTMLSQNAPTLYTGQQVQKFDQEAPPIAIPLPDKGYTRSRVFKA